MTQLENELEDSKFFESILNYPINVKHVTIEEGAKRPYTCKLEMNEKAKALMEQMLNKVNEKDNEIIGGIVNKVVDASLINETFNKPIIEQTNKEKHENILHDLRNAEADQETRLTKQQNAYRLDKQWKQDDEQESKQKKKRGI
ncbi:MAG: hypothetical protein EZS28_003061 [Streblomastix strix]|uniref:Uncharacterized protein n=1 Tax=Streblomastix strix TaxID=222440 RepID=A0A5J4X2D8_9EUKA|nr:MAG: hypothetical protein EZS28_003061 [Streblomastix strix]